MSDIFDTKILVLQILRMFHNRNLFFLWNEGIQEFLEIKLSIAVHQPNIKRKRYVILTFLIIMGCQHHTSDILFSFISSSVRLSTFSYKHVDLVHLRTYSEKTLLQSLIIMIIQGHRSLRLLTHLLTTLCTTHRNIEHTTVERISF